MQDFKIELFEKEYKINFPSYLHLSEQDSFSIRSKISGKYNLSIHSLNKELSSIELPLEDINVEENFDISRIFEIIKLSPLSKIYINWYKFDDIDLFNLVDFNKYFYDIWFPSSDDIDIFDESLNWIISIRHDGFVSYIKI